MIEETSWAAHDGRRHSSIGATAHSADRGQQHGALAPDIHGQIHDGDNITVYSDEEWLNKFGKGRTSKRLGYVLERGNAAAWIGAGGGVTVGYLFLYWLRSMMVLRWLQNVIGG